jgi:glycine cleavage system H lipoate-binding protein
MTALLVILTFLVFILIDYFLGEQPAVKPAVQPARRAPLQPRPLPALVAGFRVPEHMRFHPGHAWALQESPNLVRVGLDDFAARLTGKLDGLQLPQPGQWVRQGQKSWTLQHDGAQVDMVSPIEGTVTEVNREVLRDPELARRDPYGDGWLLKVEAPDTKVNFRNLIGGPLARWWTEEAAGRLRRYLPAPMAAMAQDGGVALDSTLHGLDDKQWTELAREFFLT